MVRPKRKSQVPCNDEVPKDSKTGAKKKPQLSKVLRRQRELDIPIKSLPPSKIRRNVKQGKEKMKFSEIRSAFSTYAKDASESLKTNAIKLVTKKKSIPAMKQKSRNTTTTHGDSEEEISDVLISNDECRVSAENCHDGQSASHCNKNAETNAEEYTSPESLLISPSDENTTDDTSYVDNMSGRREVFQEEYEKYAETFLNIKNVIKSQRRSNLPDVVVVPTEENKALVGFNENINLYGSAAIKVMKGVASVLGSVLSSKALEVTFYSPLYDPALVIKSTVSKSHETDIKTEQNAIQKILKDACFDQRSEIERLLACSTVLELSGLKKSHTYPKYKNFFDAPENVSYNELCKGCFLVEPNCVIIEYPGYQLACKEILPQAEMMKKQSLSNNTVVVTVGSKGAGKSTFNMYLTNCLLNHYELVNYIDCDIGQPEFTISGCISVIHVTTPILGPSFTHLQNPHFSTYYGAVNASHDVDRYVECVKTVLQHVKPGFPIVVNTMGWIKDVGMNLLAHILCMIQPSHVVQLSSRREDREARAHLITQDYVNQFDTMKFTAASPVSDYQHFWIKTDIPKSNLAIVNPADKRLLRTFSYFSQVQMDCALRDFHKTDDVLSLQTLCSLKPFVVYVKDVLLCVCHETGVLRRHALSVFNCSIVSLSTVSKKHFEEHSGKEYLEPTPTSKCYGFGIVRGVDPHKHALYVISNLAQETLMKINCLSVGSLTIPEALYNVDEAKSTDVTTVPYAVDDFPFHITGSNKFRSYKIFK